MRKDLTGNRYGKLTVLKVDEERTRNGKVYWLCQCDCGKITSVQSTSLTRKKEEPNLAVAPGIQVML